MTNQGSRSWFWEEHLKKSNSRFLTFFDIANSNHLSISERDLLDKSKQTLNSSKFRPPLYFAKTLWTHLIYLRRRRRRPAAVERAKECDRLTILLTTESKLRREVYVHKYLHRCERTLVAAASLRVRRDSIEIRISSGNSLNRSSPKSPSSDMYYVARIENGRQKRVNHLPYTLIIEIKSLIIEIKSLYLVSCTSSSCPLHLPLYAGHWGNSVSLRTKKIIIWILPNLTGSSKYI